MEPATGMRIYDGTDEFYMEDGGDEFVRVKRKAKDAPRNRSLQRDGI